MRAGDIVMIRTGQMQYFLEGDREHYGTPCAGPSLQSVEWFHDHDVAAVATDNIVFEVFPCEREDAMLPVHLLHLVDMGMTQGQNWNLEELAADCRRRRSLRVLPRRVAAAVHPCRREPGEPDRDQVGGGGGRPDHRAQSRSSPGHRRGSARRARSRSRQPARPRWASARGDEDRLETVLEQVREHAPGSAAFVADVSDLDGLPALATRVEEASSDRSTCS